VSPARALVPSARARARRNPPGGVILVPGFPLEGGEAALRWSQAILEGSGEGGQWDHARKRSCHRRGSRGPGPPASPHRGVTTVWFFVGPFHAHGTSRETRFSICGGPPDGSMRHLLHHLDAPERYERCVGLRGFAGCSRTSAPSWGCWLRGGRSLSAILVWRPPEFCGEIRHGKDPIKSSRRGLGP